MARRLLTAASFTRPSDTNAYASGDLVANSTTAASVVAPTFAVPVIGRDLAVVRCKLITTTGVLANGSFRAHFFQGTATVATNGDNAAILPVAGLNYLGWLDITKISTLYGIGFATDSGVPIWTPASAVAATDALNVLLEARAAYVPTSGEVFTLQPEIDYIPY